MGFLQCVARCLDFLSLFPYQTLNPSPSPEGIQQSQELVHLQVHGHGPLPVTDLSGIMKKSGGIPINWSKVGDWLTGATTQMMSIRLISDRFNHSMIPPTFESFEISWGRYRPASELSLITCWMVALTRLMQLPGLPKTGDGLKI